MQNDQMSIETSEANSVWTKPPTFALLDNREWAISLITGCIFSTYGLSFIHYSPWIPIGFLLFGCTLMHMVFSSRHAIPLPQAAILIACLYYCFGPLIALHNPAKSPLYDILNPDDYFAYAIPCLWATALGWAFAFYRIAPTVAIVDKQSSRKETRKFDGLILIGLVALFLNQMLGTSGTLGTILYLISNFRYLGVYLWVLASDRGWKSRVAFLVLVEFGTASSTSFVANFVLFLLYLVTMISFRRRLKPSLIFFIVIGAGTVLPSVQYAKTELRNATWGRDSGQQEIMVFGRAYIVTTVNKPLIFSAKIVETTFDRLMGQATEDLVSESTVRFNQGWIIDRIQAHVPLHEEYAGGETVFGTIIAAVFPRFLIPDKLTSGGRETFTRFTGVHLNTTTSMNLGFMGEMYANFGYHIGIAACTAYGLFFASIYRFIHNSSSQSILLIAFIPYVLNNSVSSEVGLVDVMNYTVKSIFVAIALYRLFPNMFKSIK